MANWRERCLNDPVRFNKMMETSWAMYDTDKSGSLDNAEAKDAFQMFFKNVNDPDLTDEEQAKFMNNFDKNKDGKISMEEFKAVVTEYLKSGTI